MQLHDPIRGDDHDHHQQQQQVNLAQRAEHILVMQSFQVKCHHDEKQGDQKQLAEFHLLGVVSGIRARSVFTLQRVQNSKVVVIHNLTFSDDQLVLLNHAVGQRDLRQGLVLLLFGHRGVVGHVGMQGVQHQGRKQLFIDAGMALFRPQLHGVTGGVHGIERSERDRGGRLVFHQTHQRLIGKPSQRLVVSHHSPILDLIE